ncbi:MAG: trypsin-like serine peptidase [Thermoanaerobaculia bacterium]
MKKKDVIDRAMRQMSYLEQAETRLENDPASVLRAVRPAAAHFEEGLESLGGRDRGLDRLRSGAEALKKVRADGASAKLTSDEIIGLEAVIEVIGRPALVVQDDSFPDPPPGWEVLEDHRKAIEKIFPSVGVIDRVIDGKSAQMGTGFMVAKNILMTNRHVAKTFAKQGAEGWSFFAGRSAMVDYRREKDRDAKVEFRIKSILDVHDDVDLALLEVDTKAVSGKAKLPPPLTIAIKGPKVQDQVYVVGYPKIDSAGATPEPVLIDIFGHDFGVKRLQPGEFDGATTKVVFKHDCSTLNGSSGSCVLSLATHEVLGLHFSGTFQVQNNAVALWALKSDKMLKGRVEFAAAKAAATSSSSRSRKPSSRAAPARAKR